MVRSPIKSIFFLSRFAPENEQDLPEMDERWGVSPFYHYKLYKALLNTGLDVRTSRAASDLVKFKSEIEYVYTIYNRADFRNSEVLVSSLCSYLKLPHLGGFPNTRAIAEDKHLCKILARNIGVDTPDWFKVDPWDNVAQIDQKISFPCIIKWRYGADSAFITTNSLAHNRKEMMTKIKEAQTQKISVIVEEFVEGSNLTIAVMGEPQCTIFDTIEIKTDLPGNIQTFDQKKFKQGKRIKCVFNEAKINASIRKSIRLLFKELYPLDYFRCDFRFDERSGRVAFLEVNAVCNLDTESTFVESVGGAIESYDKIVLRILDTSLDRQLLRRK